MKKLASLLITGALVGGIGGVTQTDLGKKMLDCTGKDHQYSISVTDSLGEKGMLYVCENEKEYGEKKVNLLKKIKDNKALDRNDKDTPASIESFIIAKNDPDFFIKIKDEIQKKYDNKSHAFIGDELDNDFIEQRALWVNMAKIKCEPACPSINNFNSFNEYVYSILNTN